MNGILLWLLLLIPLTSCTPSTYSSKLSCYFRNWDQYGKGRAKFTPADIDPWKCGVVKYAALRYLFGALILGRVRGLSFLREQGGMRFFSENFRTRPPNFLKIFRTPKYAALR